MMPTNLLIDFVNIDVDCVIELVERIGLSISI
jgi:hypothetical protein